MMALLTSRRLSLWAAPIVAVFALAFAGCAEAPDEESSEPLLEGTSELDMAAPGVARGGADTSRGGGLLRLPSVPPPADAGEESESDVLPGVDVEEPDPVPWTSRWLHANDA